MRAYNEVQGQTNPLSQRLFGSYHHVHGVGGSTLHYSGGAHRLHPNAMKMHTLFGIAADWPFTYEELEPFYSAAEKIIGVAGPAQQPGRPRSQPYPLPAHSLSYASQKIKAGVAKQLGMHWDANSLAILSRPYQGRPACNYCANCNRGCPRGDKGSVDVTFIAPALATGNCTVKSNSPVVHLEVGDHDRVVAVEYVNADGQLEKVNTPILILACGAIETPRLLLATQSPHCPQGLANDSGLVGRNFMETVFFASSGLHPEQLRTQGGIPGDSVSWDFNAPDAVKDMPGGHYFALNTPETDLIGPINYALRLVPGWGKAHKAKMREMYGHALSIAGMGESLPHPQSFITLDDTKKDKYGTPIAKIYSLVDELTLKRLEFMRTKTRDILQASGVTQVIEQYSNYDFFNTTHVFGTCRMGHDPQQSVVDKYCRSHHWKNLFIVDGSVFPSSGGGEAPSLTIEALALRTAKYIKELSQK